MKTVTKDYGNKVVTTFTLFWIIPVGRIVFNKNQRLYRHFGETKGRK